MFSNPFGESSGEQAGSDPDADCRDVNTNKPILQLQGGYARSVSSVKEANIRTQESLSEAAAYNLPPYRDTPGGGGGTTGGHPPYEGDPPTITSEDYTQPAGGGLPASDPDGSSEEDEIDPKDWDKMEAAWGVAGKVKQAMA